MSHAIQARPAARLPDWDACWDELHAYVLDSVIGLVHDQHACALTGEQLAARVFPCPLLVKVSKAGGPSSQFWPVRCELDRYTGTGLVPPSVDAFLSRIWCLVFYGSSVLVGGRMDHRLVAGAQAVRLMLKSGAPLSAHVDASSMLVRTASGQASLRVSLVVTQAFSRGGPVARAVGFVENFVRRASDPNIALAACIEALDVVSTATPALRLALHDRLVAAARASQWGREHPTFLVYLVCNCAWWLAGTHRLWPAPLSLRASP